MTQDTPTTLRTDPVSEGDALVDVQDLHLHYGSFHALKGVSIRFPKSQVTAIIGPSGCGKSTLLRSINRMNDLVGNLTIQGKIVYGGVNIYDPQVDPVEVRRHIGMVFQKPNPFPKSIFENVAFGPRLQGFKGDLPALVETSLKGAALWDEVHDKLHSSALRLSGGQQQRLCIARAIATQPQLILMDEPTSALDPIATERIEELIQQLTAQYTVVIVTHNMQQAARISDRTAFMHLGTLIEEGPTDTIFTRPKSDRTEAYITGRFG